MTHERMLNGDTEPGEKEMLTSIGRKTGLWLHLREYLATHYDHVPELDFGGKKYGWSIRYRKSGKTLVTLFPERGAFTTLVVLGKKEVAKTQEMLDGLSPAVRRLFQDARQLHDGRWLWIRPSSKADVDAIKVLLSTKRRPKPQNP